MKMAEVYSLLKVCGYLVSGNHGHVFSLEEVSTLSLNSFNKKRIC